MVYLHRCYTLAKNGRYNVAPNPMVGAVLATENEILSEGFHQQYGGPHAEPNCLQSVNHIPANATLYVSLEPCSHFGKTPPCANLIIDRGIKRVVIGNLDPNPQVAGNGIKKLEEAGIEVLVANHPIGEELNKTFNYFHRNKKPYITLKWAQTADGFIGTGTHERLHISNPVSNQWVHQLRAQHQAILVGYNTALLDNPSLDCRHVDGKNPIPFVLDPKLALPKTHKVVNNPNAVIFYESGEPYNDRCIQIKGNWITSVQDYCKEKNIHFLLVEGGAKTLQQLIEQKQWNEAFVIEGLALALQGVKAPTLKGKTVGNSNLGKDSLKQIVPDA